MRDDLQDLDQRGRRAAEAALASVQPMVQAALAAHGPRRSDRPLPKRSISRGAGIALAGAGAGVLGLIVFGVSNDSSVTDVTAGSPGQSSQPAPAVSSSAQPGSVRPGPAPSNRPPVPAADKVITSGRTTDGRSWTLSVGGPSEDLCLFVEVLDGSNAHPTVCATRAPGSPDAADPFVPRVNNDGRSTPMVFGRMPADVGQVEVVLADGRAIDRRDVIPSAAGTFFVVELPPGTTASVVVGYRQDGSSSRYSVPG